MTAELHRCIEACEACVEECQRCADECAKAGITSGERLCRNCADHCTRCIEVMNAGSNSECEYCSEVCERTAIYCDYHPEHEYFERCAQACHTCADECSRSANAA